MKADLQVALDLLEEHPALVDSVIQQRAIQAASGVYLSGVATTEGRTGLVLGLDLEPEKAQELFDFLNRLTEGAVPSWEQHQAELLLLSRAIGSSGQSGQA